MRQNANVIPKAAIVRSLFRRTKNLLPAVKEASVQRSKTIGIVFDSFGILVPYNVFVGQVRLSVLVSVRCRGSCIASTELMLTLRGRLVTVTNLRRRLKCIDVKKSYGNSNKPGDIG